MSITKDCWAGSRYSRGSGSRWRIRLGRCFARGFSPARCDRSVLRECGCIPFWLSGYRSGRLTRRRRGQGRSEGCGRLLPRPAIEWRGCRRKDQGWVILGWLVFGKSPSQALCLRERRHLLVRSNWDSRPLLIHVNHSWRPWCWDASLSHDRHPFWDVSSALYGSWEPAVWFRPDQIRIWTDSREHVVRSELGRPISFLQSLHSAQHTGWRRSPASAGKSTKWAT